VPVPVRSMLDIGSPLPAAVPKSPTPSSAKTSPTLSSHRVPLASQAVHHRSMSDAATKPALDFGPRSPPLPKDRANDPTSAYQFADIYATNVGQYLPAKRTGQAAHRSSSIGEALRGSDLSSLVLPGDRGKSFGTKGNSKSKSPHNRFSLRSNSPHNSLLGNPSTRAQPQLPPGSYALDNGQVIDMNNAYRRLSDANLLYHGSNLTSYSKKKPEPEGHGRLEKLNMSPYGEILTDDDDSDGDVVNSSDEESQRGRKLHPREEDSGKISKTLLGAAEDERKFLRTCTRIPLLRNF
jgi:hypothetical protein